MYTPKTHFRYMLKKFKPKIALDILEDCVDYFEEHKHEYLISKEGSKYILYQPFNKIVCNIYYKVVHAFWLDVFTSSQSEHNLNNEFIMNNMSNIMNLINWKYAVDGRIHRFTLMDEHGLRPVLEEVIDDFPFVYNVVRNGHIKLLQWCLSHKYITCYKTHRLEGIKELDWETPWYAVETACIPMLDWLKHNCNLIPTDYNGIKLLFPNLPLHISQLASLKKLQLLAWLIQNVPNNDDLLMDVSRLD